jgi:RNA polymerase sigma factor (sigma-70 family)
VSAEQLADLLVTHRETLLGIVRARGAGLLRYETAEDLVQGIHLHALSVGEHFEYRSEPEFLGWLRRVADQHIANRHRYWKAQKRRATRMLRITRMAATSTHQPGGVEPAADQPGASTFAVQREMVVQATRALEMLLPRDQEIIRRTTEGWSIARIAEELGMTHGAAERARLRAQERFRKAFGALTGSPPPPAG